MFGNDSGVGILQAFKLLGGKTTPTGRGVRAHKSPWSGAPAGKIVWSDIFGVEALTINRSEAMSLPPVTKARSIIVSQIAPAPLVCLDENGVAAEQPKWLQHTDGQLSPYHRMLWTLDDLIFAGISLWGVTREDGQIVDAERIPLEWWETTADGSIHVQGDEVDESEVILFTAATEGLLEIATRSFRGAVALEHEWVRRAKSPIPVVEIRETVETNLEDEEVEGIVQTYIDARADDNGTVAFIPFGLELHAHGETAPNLAIEARNFVKVDVANFTGLPAEALDGSLSTASLTYSTQEGSRNEILDYAIAYWSDPIAARLSQDDVVPSGQRVRFDFGNLRTVTPTATGTPTKD